MGTPFDFDISVKADKARRNRRRGTKAGFNNSTRGCEWPDCQERGVHRAPKSPQDLDSFRWFCSDHIREYNRAWDYYKGMSADEIDKARKADQTWDRPTWSLTDKAADDPVRKAHADGKAWERFGFKDAFEVLGENATINPGSALEEAEKRSRRRLLPKADQKALDVIGLEVTATPEDVRERYKALVKELHPDMNGGDRSEEARLQEVIGAWNHLKRSAAFKQK